MDAIEKYKLENEILKEQNPSSKSEEAEFLKSKALLLVANSINNLAEILKNKLMR
mgnify:CR=1 FL=1